MTICTEIPPKPTPAPPPGTGWGYEKRSLKKKIRKSDSSKSENVK